MYEAWDCFRFAVQMLNAIVAERLPAKKPFYSMKPEKSTNLDKRFVDFILACTFFGGEGKASQFCILSNSVAGFVSADRTAYPVCFYIYHGLSFP